MGGFFMGETMLVTQALDERDLLVKKITDKIEKASFVAWIPMMEMLILKGSFRMSIPGDSEPPFR